MKKELWLKLTFTLNGNHKNQPVELNYTCEHEIVTISISGIDRRIEDFYVDSKESGFNHLLIETFLQQIDASIEIERNKNDEFLVTFKQINSNKGSNNALNDHKNIISNKNVA